MLIWKKRKRKGKQAEILTVTERQHQEDLQHLCALHPFERINLAMVNLLKMGNISLYEW